jgi:hypothetical protein
LETPFIRIVAPIIGSPLVSFTVPFITKFFTYF